VSSDAARDRLVAALARLRDQLAGFAAMPKKQAALEVSAAAAEGSVVVTVNARGQVVKTLIDQSYLDDHDFDELGDHITEAAQAAARKAGGRVAEMLSDIVEGVPDPGDVLPPGLEVFSAAAPRREGLSVSWVGGSPVTAAMVGLSFPR
jgi:DNA-binding protein YbaB